MYLILLQKINTKININHLLNKSWPYVIPYFYDYSWFILKIFSTNIDFFGIELKSINPLIAW